MRNAYGMQFIMDGNGNYYRTNDNNQLVVAAGREEATEFTLYDANQRIGGGKKAAFYFTIPVEERTVEKVLIQPQGNDSNTGISANRYDIAHFNWTDYLWQFCYMASVAGRRQDELTAELSEVDQKICDMLHLIELYDLTSEEGLHTIALLKEVRQMRRDIKDEMTCLDYFQTSFGTEKNITEAKNIIKQIKKLNYRVYRPRQMPELFEGMKGRETDRKVYWEETKKQDTSIIECMDIEQEVCEGEKSMEYERKETIYDSRKNDWLAFAKEQMDFYQNIPQYMINLQIELDAVVHAIEQTLTLIEDANYNVAQGYKAFKELKDLRNERKEKQKELECLKALTAGFNCGVMEEMYRDGINALKEIMNVSFPLEENEDVVVE